MSTERAGRFVVLEGGEGSGKSTQAALLVERLRSAGRRATLTREPGGSRRGERIRDLLLHDHGALDPRAELLLVLADRALHVAEIVRPCLGVGDVVVSDRHTPSSLAYQGVGRGLGVAEVERMSGWAADGLVPDLVVVLDLDDEVAEARLAAERDRMEQAGTDFHRRVRAAYRELAPTRGWVVVDGAGSADDVAARVWAAVEPVLP